MRAQNIQHLATNMAVEHTARDAHDRDYSVVILKDACETASEEGHKAALESISRFCKIISTSQFLGGEE